MNNEKDQYDVKNVITYKKNRTTFQFGGEGYYRLKGSNLYLKERKSDKKSW